MMCSQKHSPYPDGTDMQYHNFLLEKTVCDIERIAATLQMGLGLKHIISIKTHISRNVVDSSTLLQGIFCYVVNNTRSLKDLNLKQTYELTQKDCV